jgi:8-amino-7-oxononanoate synthase
MATTQERPAELARLARELGALEAAGLLRHRRTLSSAQGARVVVDGVPLLSFCSNDYLGLAADPVLAQALVEGVARHGVGAGASHLLTGHTLAHTELEAALARWCGLPAALLFSSGYMANLGVAGALLGRGDVMFADRLNHACLNDGALLARARLVRYAHADASSLARALERTPARRRLIATDAVFSMDGDLAPLRELLGLAERHDAWLMVDDAHGFGVLGDGRGSLAELGLDPRRCAQRVIYMGTLGKAAGVAGAFVAGAPELVDWLVQKARTSVYTTASPPALAVALAASLERIAAGQDLRARLAESIARLRVGLAALPAGRLAGSSTAIQPLIVGESVEAVRWSEALAARGLLVPAIRPPTVPVGTARLRISLSAAHGPDDIDRLVTALHEVATERAGLAAAR